MKHKPSERLLDERRPRPPSEILDVVDEPVHEPGQIRKVAVVRIPAKR
jgi:hypothetical protein